MRNVIVFVVALTVFGGRFVAAEESLADAAAKEKERRKGQKAPKVITEGDLLDAKGRSVSATGETGQPAPAASGKSSGTPSGSTASGNVSGQSGDLKPKSDDDVRAEKEKDWRVRHDAAEAEVTRLSQVVSDLQANASQYSSDLLKSRLDDAQKALDAARASAAALEDERRFAGYR